MNHFVARIDDGLHRCEDAFRSPHRGDHLGHRVQGTTKQRTVERRQGLDQFLVAAAARVLVEILGDGVLAGLLDEVRRREVGEALP